MKAKKLINENSHHTFSVSAEYAGNRIDKFITAQFPLYSRTFLAQLIGNGHVKVNDKKTTKASFLVKEGDIVTLDIPAHPTKEASHALLETIPPIDVVYEHEHFFILNKPAGLLVHAPSNASTSPTLVDWLLHNFKEIQQVGAIDRPGIVHRLDKETSGLIVIPRTNYAHSEFGTMFRDRTIKKTYLALVHGHPDPAGVIEAAIGRDAVTKTRMTTKFSSGKMRTATSYYRVLEYFDDAALVEVKPVTGRTHQIRVHLASIGHPIIGDMIYGRKSKMIKRHALHAAELSFAFDDKELDIKSELPEDMQSLIQQLRKA